MPLNGERRYGNEFFVQQNIVDSFEIVFGLYYSFWVSVLLACIVATDSLAIPLFSSNMLFVSVDSTAEVSQRLFLLGAAASSRLTAIHAEDEASKYGFAPDNMDYRDEEG